MGFAGAVLAGGRSIRMGRDKALIEVAGVPMAGRVAVAIRDAGATEVVVVGGTAEARSGLGLRFVPDLFPGDGPLGGILTALRAFGTGLVVIGACDLPHLDVATVLSLVDSIGRHDLALARTDRLEPLCGIWRSETCVPVLQAAFDDGERAIHRAIARLSVIKVDVAGAPLTNINTPADLGASDLGTSALGPAQ